MRLEAKVAILIKISENDAPQRLDRYIRRRFPELSLSRIYSLIRKGLVKVNGSRVKKQGTLLLMGQHLEILGLVLTGKSAHRRPESDSASIPFPILHEDRDVLVVDKPTGVSVHPGGRIPAGDSLIEKFRAYLGHDSNSLFRPSLVHRLDRETSGILLIAKTGRFLRHMAAQLSQGRVSKTYFALVAGRPDRERGFFTEKLLRKNRPFGGKKSLVNVREGKIALTQFELTESFGEFSLLRLYLLTGRHHQIRAHLSHHGLPILGDSRYGNPSHNRRVRHLVGLNRVFLHAAEIKFTGLSGENSRFTAMLPAELKGCLRKLRK